MNAYPKTRYRCSIAVAVALLVCVDGISTHRAGAAPVETARAPSAKSSAKSLTDEFDLMPKMLSASKGRSDGDPLKAISQRMTIIHGDLSQLATDEPVQTKERQVVRSLDELIAALQKHCSGLGRGNVPNGGRKESVIANGDPSSGDLHGVDPTSRQWAQLPPKLRKEILQSKTDGFPPGYETLLQSYYQQLAEEKSLDDKTASPSPGADSKGSDPKRADSKPVDSKPVSP